MADLAGIEKNLSRMIALHSSLIAFFKSGLTISLERSICA